MSTRANIHFGFRKQDTGEFVTLANIYRHSDGYPHSILPGLEKFFAAVQEQASDTRFDAPAYLAAKYVVWQAWEYAKSRGRFSFTEAEGTVAPLDFLSVGVMTQDAGDAEYIYEVAAALDNGRPTVTHHEA